MLAKNKLAKQTLKGALLLVTTPNPFLEDHIIYQGA